MPNHKEWMDLPIITKIELVGKVTHLLQNQYPYYLEIIKMLEEAEAYGLFNDVKINNKNEQI